MTRKFLNYFILIGALLVIVLASCGFGFFNFNSEINVRDFGAKGNGIDNDTIALQNAFKYARENKISTVNVPNGIYLVNAVSRQNTEQAIHIYDGINLKGSGQNTIFKVDPSSMEVDGFYRLFLYESNVTIQGIQIDGQKDLIDRSDLSKIHLYAIHGSSTDLRNITVQDIWIHDIIGVNNESFGVMTTGGSKNILFKRIIGWNIEGTPIHISGDYLNNNPVKDVTVENCVTYQNSWQGISIYGAVRSKIVNHHSYDNVGNGINLEWCSDINILSSKSHDNYKGGIGSFGKANFKVVDSVFYKNNKENNNPYGEISLRAGKWFTGNPVPRGVAENVEIKNCVVTPLNGKAHLYIESSNNVNEGDTIPDKIILNSPGDKNWIIKSRDVNNTTKENYFVPCITYKHYNSKRYVPTSNVKNYTAAGKLSLESEFFNGVKLVANSQYANAKANVMLKPNTTYHIKARFKTKSQDKWTLLLSDKKQLNPATIALYGSYTKQDTWVEAEGIITTQQDNYEVKIQYNGTTFPSEINIDYIQIYQLLN